MKSLLIFFAGAAVAALLVFGFLASQNPQNAVVPNTDGTDTTTQTGTTGTQGTAVTPGVPVTEGDHLLYTINYNNGVFTPTVLNIKRGDSVKFVNKDNLTLRVSVKLTTPVTGTSNMLDSHSLGKGGTYSVSMSVPGVWIITNDNETGVGVGVGILNVH